MKTTFSESSAPPFELNALAPLRIGGLAQALLDNAENPDQVRRIARELLDLEPHILAMLIDVAEATPELAEFPELVAA